MRSIEKEVSRIGYLHHIEKAMAMVIARGEEIAEARESLWSGHLAGSGNFGPARKISVTLSNVSSSETVAAQERELEMPVYSPQIELF